MVALRKLTPHSPDARNAASDLAETAASNRAAVPSGDTTIQRLPNGRYRVHDPATGEEIGQAPNRSAAVRMAQLAAENANGFDPDSALAPASVNESLEIDPPLTEETPPLSIWKPHPGFRMPAEKNGRFLGEIGNSPFSVSDAKADHMGIPRGSTIPWVQGIPDFGAHAVTGPMEFPSTFSVTGMSGNHKMDRKMTIQHIAKKTNLPQSRVEEWLSDNDVVLHHSGGNGIQIVPRKIHELHHSGGAQQLRSRK